MKQKTAIEFFKSVRANVREANLRDIQDSNEVVIINMMLEVYLTEAIDALEKQMPKAPKLTGGSYGYRCPCCNAYIFCEYDDKYCCECGQALDWGDE